MTDLTKSAVFSADKAYRYVLRRIWNTSVPPCCFIMLNPSIAGEEADDPTITRCLSFAKEWAHGGLTVGNLFAYVATDPRELRRARDPVGPENDGHIKQLHAESGVTVVAWGDGGEWLNRGRAVMQLLRTTKKPAFLAKTTKGQPKHPLYVKAGTRPKFKYYPSDTEGPTFSSNREGPTS